MENRKPDEVSAWEYLNEHLWQRAWQGGFSEDFASLKAVLPSLRGFEHLTDLLKSLAEAGNRNGKEEVVHDLIKLYQKRFDLHPATITVLLLIFWDDLTEQYGRGDRFARSYWDLIKALENETGLIR